jgi:hypothetical protein
MLLHARSRGVGGIPHFLAVGLRFAGVWWHSDGVALVQEEEWWWWWKRKRSASGLKARLSCDKPKRRLSAHRFGQTKQDRQSKIDKARSTKQDRQSKIDKARATKQDRQSKIEPSKSEPNKSESSKSNSLQLQQPPSSVLQLRGLSWFPRGGGCNSSPSLFLSIVPISYVYSFPLPLVVFLCC